MNRMIRLLLCFAVLFPLLTCQLVLGQTNPITDANWMSMGGIPGVDGYVYATALDPSGNLYVGGYFFVAGGVPANMIARWDGTNWTSLGSGMANDVLALTWWNGALYAGGGFTNAGGVAANSIAKWD